MSNSSRQCAQDLGGYNHPPLTINRINPHSTAPVVTRVQPPVAAAFITFMAFLVFIYVRWFYRRLPCVRRFVNGGETNYPVLFVMRLQNGPLVAISILYREVTVVSLPSDAVWTTITRILWSLFQIKRS